jgi:hypothetical protein
MAVTFDGPNTTITLESGVTQFDWEDVYSDWKRWVNDGGGDPYAPAFSVGGGEPVTDTLFAGSYFFLRNDLGWRIRPPEEDITIYPTGNLAVQDLTKPSILPTIGAFTAAILGIQPITQGVAGVLSNNVEEIHGGVVREVWLDTSLLSNGNGYQQSPFNNLTSAIDYAEAKGITSLVILDDVTLDRNLKNFNVRGVGMPTIDTAGYDLKGVRFEQVKLQGNYTSQIIAQECVLLTNARLNGNFETCALAGDLLCVPGGDVFMTGCGSAVPGLGRPTITMSSGGARVLLSVRNNDGGMTIKGCTHADDEVTVEVNRGSLTFDASNTGGSMVARTSGKFIDATAGATVTNENYAQEIWQMNRLDPDNPRETDEDGTIRVGGNTITAATVGTTPNRTTTQTRT